jgi:hypothetical protein
VPQELAKAEREQLSSDGAPPEAARDLLAQHLRRGTRNAYVNVFRINEPSDEAFLAPEHAEKVGGRPKNPPRSRPPVTTAWQAGRSYPPWKETPNPSV